MKHLTPVLILLLALVGLGSKDANAQYNPDSISGHRRLDTMLGGLKVDIYTLRTQEGEMLRLVKAN